MKYCSGCDNNLDISLFNTRIVNGKRYPQSRCRKCIKIKGMNKIGSNHKLNHNKSNRKSRKTLRQNPASRARFILEDARNSDKKHDLVCDLDRQFIQLLIDQGCSYCGVVVEVKMSLDRIDNNVGHTKTNVNPACIDCNLTRGNMPYIAWLKIAPTMRELRQSGMFAGWTRRRL